MVTALITKFGDESDKWISKKISIHREEMPDGKVIRRIN
jgi:hypothetical protein